MATKKTDIDNLVTRKRFIELCSFEGDKINYRTLQTDIRRGNVIEVDGQIDTEHPTNKSYLEKRVESLKNRKNGLTRLTEAERKTVELEIKKEELEIKKLTRQKMEAELIPADKIFLAMNSHFRFVRQQFYFAADQIATDTVRKFGGSKKDISEVKANLIKVCNDLVDKSNKQAADEVNSIIEEYRSLYGA